MIFYVYADWLVWLRIVVLVCLNCISFVICVLFFFFFKQKTAYEMRISDWSSDVCSSDLVDIDAVDLLDRRQQRALRRADQRPFGDLGAARAARNRRGDRKSVV